MINKNKYKNDFSGDAISKADNSFKRDWKPIETISQDDVNEIPFIDVSKKTIFVALIVFFVFGLLVSNIEKVINYANQIQF